MFVIDESEKILAHFEEDDQLTRRGVEEQPYSIRVR